MSLVRQRLLQIPQGTESLHLDEAYRHRQLVREIEDVFTGWGYLPARVPVFDFYDGYRSMLDDEATETAYRLVDRDGDLLMLRSDITLFLAKQMGLALRKDDLPVRVCYADSILRHQKRHDISRNEFFQVGCELIGKEGLWADAEVLTLLCTLFGSLGTDKAYVHVGSRAFFSAVARALESKDAAKLARAVTYRDADSVVGLLAKSHERKLAEAVATLFSFIGSPAQLPATESWRTILPSCPDLVEPLEYLVNVANEARASGNTPEVRIDLSEIGAQAYYTGIVFSGYLEGADSAIASGGRYDELLGNFGFDCPSVGFSVLLRKMEAVAGIGSNLELPEAIAVHEESFAESLKTAQKLRNSGRPAVID